MAELDFVSNLTLATGADDQIDVPKARFPIIVYLSVIKDTLSVLRSIASLI